jgi:hypothetical protein
MTVNKWKIKAISSIRVITCHVMIELTLNLTLLRTVVYMVISSLITDMKLLEEAVICIIIKHRLCLLQNISIKEYCGVFAQSKNCGRETAVAR